MSGKLARVRQVRARVIAMRGRLRASQKSLNALIWLCT